jgi:hypothetical protein
MAKYFSKTYGEARWLFKEAALDMSKKYKYAEYRTIRIPSRTDQDLTIDTFYLPAQAKHEKLVILTAGVHGIEGMTGSAIELLCMREDIITSNIDKARTGILFIHGMNPYGQKYHRRVTENNVDLGRNFRNRENEINGSEGPPQEDRIQYVDLYDYLNPEKKYAYNFLSRLVFRIRSLALLSKSTANELRQAILEGQYEFEKGVFFGGSEEESQLKIIEELLVEYLSGYSRIFALDLHTGYGIPGDLHFVLPYTMTSDRSLFDSIFEGFEIASPGPEQGRIGTCEVKGSFLQFLEKTAKGKIVCPIILKYGTIDSRRLSCQIDSLERIIHENQCFQYGYRSEKDKKLIQKSFREMYFPESEAWRESILAKTRDTLPALMKRFDAS